MLSHDVVFKPRLLDKLLLKCKYNVIGVAEVVSKKRRKSKGMSSSSFWGMKGVVYFSLVIIAKKFLSAARIIPHLSIRATIKKICKLYSIQYRLIDNVNDPDFLKYLSKLNPDIIVSFQHQIFKDNILELPNIACINCHPAKLPKYRGVKPIFWSMLNNDKDIGISVHTMSKKIDMGHIISQTSFPLVKNNTLLDNYYIAYSLSTDVILDALDSINKNEDLNSFPTIPNDSAYYSHPKKKDLLKFKQLGYKVI